jgi:hypothetical protein
MEIFLNERDMDRLDAVARYRGMSNEDCSVGLIQQAIKTWEENIWYEIRKKVNNDA